MTKFWPVTTEYEIFSDLTGNRGSLGRVHCSANSYWYWLLFFSNKTQLLEIWQTNTRIIHRCFLFTLRPVSVLPDRCCGFSNAHVARMRLILRNRTISDDKEMVDRFVHYLSVQLGYMTLFCQSLFCSYKIYLIHLKLSCFSLLETVRKWWRETWPGENDLCTCQ